MTRYAALSSLRVLLCLVCLWSPRAVEGFDWRFEGRGERIVRSLGANNNKAAKEISGVVASRTQTARGGNGTAGGVLWSHNDSGSGPYLFALNASTGEHIAWFELEGDNIPNSDWEDIAIGPGPVFGQDYIYIGDVGDAGGHSNGNKIIRFPEPKLPYYYGGNAAVVRAAGRAGDGGGEAPAQSFDPWELIPITDFEVIHFKYPSGKTHNCEALTIDPITGDIFVAAKHSNRLDVYVLHYKDLKTKGVNELKLHYSSCNDYGRTGTEECEHCKGCVDSRADYNTLVAADISPSGYGLIMSDYKQVFYWKREFLNESFFEYEAVQLPYMNRHGTEEALAWSWDSKGYFVVPEGSFPELRYYPYYGDVWWSKLRDYEGSCYAFIPPPTSSIPRIRSNLAGKGAPLGSEAGRGPVSSCISVPCSEVSDQKQRVAASMVSFFEGKEQCETWKKFYNRMTRHGVDWLKDHNKIDFVNVDVHEEFDFIHEDMVDLIEDHLDGIEG
uniref:Uncharacterized protein n=1 Tax=Chloropicon primus TaxID=1764295 RepID=A0A7S2X1F2_9CHLO|mmetsp:Transcript_8807/g.25134  ORF Transcript_8807/g.25134 Transcript_8807/m.25134 type:complete len:499 (+) Transcript_8807:224-1720(+)